MCFFLWSSVTTHNLTQGPGLANSFLPFGEVKIAFSLPYLAVVPSGAGALMGDGDGPGPQPQVAATRSTLKKAGVLFDPQFEFHFYDLDFCRTAGQRGRQTQSSSSHCAGQVPTNQPQSLDA